MTRTGFWRLTGGGSYNPWTGGTLPGSRRPLSNVLGKFGADVMNQGVGGDFTIDNLFDKRYVIFEYDLDADATVLPGVGREFHFKLSYKFK